jgi:hypothetical protein
MTTLTATDRSSDSSPTVSRGILGHPLAFVSTGIIVFLLYGWPFLVHPQRLAPTTDPAYYSWRIETLISESPANLLRIKGPFNTAFGGYRVAGTVLGSALRRIADISELKTTIVLMIALWTVTALLLAGFAYRERRDPLIFHVVALGSGSLLITPPFTGYSDNILCLLLLTGAIWFVAGAVHDWKRRLALALFLIVAGFTHPTTLIIFCFTLGALGVVRLLTTRFDLKTTLRLEGPILATAAVALMIMFLSWGLGVWGVSQSLSEAATAPPQSAAVFHSRLLSWLAEMYPLWNGPLLAIGIIGMLIAWRRGKQENLARFSIVWLLPLLGVFGFLVGLSYPYYRFFNSTLAWVLLIGLGGYLVVRSSIDVSRRGGIARVALVGVLIAVVPIGATFTLRFLHGRWNNPSGGWISYGQRRSLDHIRAALSRQDTAGRPIIFVLDTNVQRSWKYYSFSKTESNRFRYGLPPGQISDGYGYLGSLANLISGRPTLRGIPLYDRLSRADLHQVMQAITSSQSRPIFIVNKAFNVSGANAPFFHGQGPLPTTDKASIWWVGNGQILARGRPIASRHWRAKGSASSWHLVRVLGGILLLLLPGFIGARRLLSGLSVGEMLGIVPALSIALVAFSGILVLAVARSPFTGAVPWITLALAIALATLAPGWPRRRRAGVLPGAES